MVGPASTALLIDPSWEPDELEDLSADLAHLGLTVTAGLATHAHYDHLLWHPGFGSAPRWASATTCRLAVTTRAESLAELGDHWPAHLVALYGDVQPTSGATLDWDGPQVQLVEHDGHLPGHLAAWLPSLGLLVAGDMLSDVEPPLLSEEPDAVTAYLEGLDRLAPFAAAAAYVVPGHGHVTTRGAERLAHDRTQVLAAPPEGA